MSARADNAQRNRDQMPQAAAFVADVRRVFGADIKPTFVREAGIELGKRVPLDGVKGVLPSAHWPAFRAEAMVMFKKVSRASPAGSFEFAEFLSEYGAKHWAGFLNRQAT